MLCVYTSMNAAVFSSHSSALLNSCQLQASHNPVPSLSYWFLSRGLYFAEFSERWLNSFPLEWFSWPDPARGGESSRHLGVSLIHLEKSLCHAVGYGWPVCFWGNPNDDGAIFFTQPPYFFLPQMVHLFMLFCANLWFLCCASAART